MADGSNGELLKEIRSDVRETREGQIKLSAKVDELTGDVRKLNATVIEGEGSIRPLKGRVDALEDHVKSMRKKLTSPPAAVGYRPEMHSEISSSIAAVKPETGKVRKWLLPILLSLITVGGGIAIALLTS
jgi:outer membrane murein-binding lipoprotein Lpp